MKRSCRRRSLVQALERRTLLSAAAQVPTLAAAGVTPSEIDLAWTGGVDPSATGIAIERSQGDMQFVQIASPALAASSYADQKLPALTNYRYRLREDLADGTSAESNVVSASSLPASLFSTAFKSVPFVIQTSSSPTHLGVSNGLAYFWALNQAGEDQLWRTDGTAAGTTVANPTFQRATNDYLSPFMHAAGVTYVAVDVTLYRVDDGKLTPLIKYAYTPQVDPIGGAAEYNGAFYAIAPVARFGDWALVKSDGTATGTTVIQDIGTRSSPLTVAAGRLFFSGNLSNPALNGLYTSDGTTAGTRLLPLAESLQQLFPATNRVYAAAGGDVWTSDGTDAGTIALSTHGSAFPDPAHIAAAVIGNDFYFIAPAGAQRTEHLWRTDGTPEGTQTVADLGIDPSRLPDAQHIQLTGANSAAFFLLPTGPGGNEQLWRSDGSDGGTVPIADLADGVPVATSQMFSAGGSIYFSTVAPGNIRTDVWTSDGTINGTRLLRSISPGAAAGASAWTVAGGTTYFVASDQFSGWQLWKTDGSPAGTVPLASFTGGMPTELTPYGALLLFSANDSTHGRELWESDGTVAGTEIVKDIGFRLNPAPLSPIVAGDNGTAVFVGHGTVNSGPGLWATSGSPSTNVPLGQAPDSLYNANGTVYFPIGGGAAGSPITLMKTDGTPAGTVAVGPAGDSRFIPIGALKNKFFFASGLNPQPLWVTDGTAAGTHTIAGATIGGPDAGVATAAPVGVAAGSVLYYLDGTGVSASGGQDQIWRTDGTAEGTAMVGGFDPNSTRSLHLTDLNGTLLIARQISANPYPDGYELYEIGPSDSILTELRTFYAGSSIVILGDTAFFVAEDPTTGWALYASDGTTDGTRLVVPLASPVTGTADLFQVPSPEGFFYLTINGALYRSDGTAAGTVPVGPTGVRTEGMRMVGNDLFFVKGSTLWVTDGTVLGSRQVDPYIDLSPFFVGSEDRLFYVGPIDTNAETTPLQMASVAPLDAPTRVSVSWYAAAGTGGATLTWAEDDMIDPAGFVIERSTHDDFSTIDRSFFVPAGTTSFSDSTVGDSLGFFYRVRAVDAGGSSPPSTIVPVQFAVIRGSVFNDANHNGVPDPGEAGSPGVTVFIDSNGNGRLESGEIQTVTDALGSYVLGGLARGSYPVLEVPPAGTRRTTTLTGTGVAAALGAVANGPVFGNTAVSSVPLDFSYLLVLAQNYGRSGTFATGDLTDDGKVDFDDLLILAQNYGHPLTSAAPTTGRHRPKQKG